jgi:hypothetical protein
VLRRPIETTPINRAVELEHLHATEVKWGVKDSSALYHVTSWPTTVLIDRNGNVANYEDGFESEGLRAALQKLGIGDRYFQVR